MSFIEVLSRSRRRGSIRIRLGLGRERFTLFSLNHVSTGAQSSVPDRSELKSSERRLFLVRK